MHKKSEPSWENPKFRELNRAAWSDLGEFTKTVESILQSL